MGRQGMAAALAVGGCLVVIVGCLIVVLALFATQGW